MDTKTSRQKTFKSVLFFATISLLLFLSFSMHVNAQDKRAIDGEMAICKITVDKKIYQPLPNQVGCFDMISNIKPLATIPVEVSYSNGKAGDKVILTVEDGGKLDNGKGIRIAQLDNLKKLSFSFTVSNQPGLFRVTLSKGNDTKTIQLWVGEEPIGEQD